MYNINQTIIEGFLVKDPHISFVGKEKLSLCKIVIANNTSIKKNNLWENKPCFLKILAWGKLGENCNLYLKKGSKILISGKIKQNIWKTKDNKYKEDFFIEAHNINFLKSPKGRVS